MYVMYTDISTTYLQIKTSIYNFIIITSLQEMMMPNIEVNVSDLPRLKMKIQVPIYPLGNIQGQGHAETK